MTAEGYIETNDHGMTKDGIKVPYPDATSPLQIGKNIGYVMGIRASQHSAQERYDKALQWLTEQKGGVPDIDSVIAVNGALKKAAGLTE